MKLNGRGWGPRYMAISTSAKRLGAASPFEHWRVQEHDPHYGYAWWLEGPRCLVTQTTFSRLDLSGVRVLHDWVDSIIEAEGIPGSPPRGMLVVHDWRSLAGYDHRSRSYFMLRMRKRKSNYLRRTYVGVSPNSRLLKMAIETANVFGAMVLKARIQVETGDLSKVLEAEGIQTPSVLARFPKARA